MNFLENAFEFKCGVTYRNELQCDVSNSTLTVPNGVIQELNRLIFKFLWKGVDKVRGGGGGGEVLP